jgi:hypothetical protein
MIDLRSHLQMLRGKDLHIETRSSGPRRAAVCGFFVFSVLIRAAQGPVDPPRPQFEVVSIKLALPDERFGGMTGGPGTRDPELFTANAVDLASLLTTAYDIPWYRFSGPDWMKSTRFTIRAKVPAGTTKEAFRLMQQDLLLSRFKMIFHKDQKEMQGTP